MIYGSVCSGVEAASLAWEPLGWRPAWFSELDKFPCAVLNHHWPQVPNVGDMTQIATNEVLRNERPIELLVGGTPCQSFSVAGLRKGMDDERGNLALEYVRILQSHRPRWFVWENVAGVFSSNRGSDFACFLSAITGRDIQPQKFSKAGVIQGIDGHYSLAWRVLDAQYFGVAQRRKRVFVVGFAGTDWRPPAGVLLEPDCLLGNPAPLREARQSPTTGVDEGFTGSSRGEFVRGTGTLRASGGDNGGGSETLAVIPPVAGTLDTECGGGRMNHQTACSGHIIPDTIGCITARMFAALGARDVEEGAVIPINDKATRHAGGGATRSGDGSGNGLGIGQPGDPSPTLTAGDKHAVAVHGTQDPCVQDEHGFALGRNNGSENAVAIHENQRGEITTNDTTGALSVGGGKPGQGYPAVQADMVVRKLTPVECERLQGMPDNHTKIPWRNKAIDDCPDGPRYKAIGNSMAVPVMHWIGRRIQMMDEVIHELS